MPPDASRHEGAPSRTDGVASSPWGAGSYTPDWGECSIVPGTTGRHRGTLHVDGGVDYAAYLGLDAAGAPVLKSYGAYDDVWVPHEGEWRLAYRETVMHGHAPSASGDGRRYVPFFRDPRAAALLYQIAQ
jgi:hypothetical protein